MVRRITGINTGTPVNVVRCSVPGYPSWSTGIRTEQQYTAVRILVMRERERAAGPQGNAHPVVLQFILGGKR